MYRHRTEILQKNVESKSECEQCHGDYQEAHQSVGQKSIEANSFSVEQNFPNPFSNGTTVRYSLDRHDSVSIEIFDMQGRRVKTIMSNKPHGSGEYTIEWDGTNDQGGRVEAGVYIFRFRAGSKIQTVSMMKV